MWAIVVPTVPAASCATTDKDNDVEHEWSDESEEESEAEKIDDEAVEYASESSDFDDGDDILELDDWVLVLPILLLYLLINDIRINTFISTSSSTLSWIIVVCMLLMWYN